MLALVDDLPGNRPGPFLFAVDTEDCGQFLQTGDAKDVPSGCPKGAAHTHIERTFSQETETSRRLVELTRTHAEVEQHPIHHCDSQTHQHSFQLHIVCAH